MRLRNVKNKDDILNSCPYLITNPSTYKGNFASLFNNNNPIYLEIGMGKGKFILENAINNNVEITFRLGNPVPIFFIALARTLSKRSIPI